MIGRGFRHAITRIPFDILAHYIAGLGKVAVASMSRDDHPESGDAGRSTNLTEVPGESKDAMHRGVHWVSPDPVIELAKLMREHASGRY